MGFLGMRPSPLVVAANDKIGVVHFFGKVGCVVGQSGTVTIAHGVCAPQFGNFFCAFDKVFVGRYCYSSFFHITLSSIVLKRPIEFSVTHNCETLTRALYTLQSTLFAP